MHDAEIALGVLLGVIIPLDRACLVVDPFRATVEYRTIFNFPNCEYHIRVCLN